jgi:hypothetical protein
MQNTQIKLQRPDAKADKSRQIEAQVETQIEPATDELSASQQSAIAFLLAGKSDGETAKQIGVTRQTVNEWKNHNPAFIASLNARRLELWEAHAQRLRGLVGAAVDALEGTLDSCDAKVRQAAAVHVLRAVGLYGGDLQPSGEVTAADVERQQTRDEITKSLLW